MCSSSYSANWHEATISPKALSRMTLYQMSLSQMSLSPWSNFRRPARMALDARSESVLLLQRRCAFGLVLGSCLVSFLCCTLFISGNDSGTRGGIILVSVRVAGLFVSFVLINFSQALIITDVAKFLDCSGCIFYLFIVLCGIAHAVFLQLLAWWCWGSKNLPSVVSWYPHQTAQAQHHFSSHSTVNPRLLQCHWQYQRRPHSVAPNFHADKSSLQTAGNINISIYTILNTIKLQRIWLFTVRPETLNPLWVVNSTLTMIESKTWKRFPTSNTLKTMQMKSLNYRHHFWRGRKHTPGPLLRWVITLLSHGNGKLRVSLRLTYSTIPAPRLRSLNSKNICSVVSRRRVRRHTMTTCWRKKIPLCFSQASKTGIVSRS